MEKKILSFGTVVTSGGMAAVHPSRALPLYVAPSTRDEFETKNQVRLSIEPIACWRLDDPQFEFDSSFVRPEAAEELGVLAEMIRTQPDMPMSVFGHADPVGDDAYNIVLSSRRGKAIYGIMTRNPDLWEELWTPWAGDNWDAKGAANTMLAELGYGHDADEKSRFREEHGLPKGPYLLKEGRLKLYEDYMKRLFPLKLKPEAFLAGGKGKNLKGDLQGCGEFNPILLLSDKQNRGLPQKERDEKNGANRRVVVFFYEPGTLVDPDLWPCPAANSKGGGGELANIAACQNRFWSDHKARLKPDPEEQREFKQTFNTFACRFYHRMAGWSPCEGGQAAKAWVVRFVLPDGPPPTKGKPLADEPFVATVGGGTRRVVGQTDANGVLRVRRHADEEILVVKIAGREIRVRAGELKRLEDAPVDAQVKPRLYNLGYGQRIWTEWTEAEYRASLRLFQKQHGVPEAEWGTIGAQTIAALKKMHDGDGAGAASAGGGGSGEPGA